MRSSILISVAGSCLAVAFGCSGSDPSDSGAAAMPAAPAPASTVTPGGDGSEAAPAGAPALGAGTPEDMASDLPLAGGAGVEGEAPADGDSPPAGEASGPVQDTLAPLLSVRQEHAVVALRSEIFVVGGFTPNATGSVEAYNPASDTWRSVAAFPNVLHHANAVAIDGKLIVAGFYLGGSFTDARGNTFEYDPALDTWTEKASMPAGTERASSCVVAFDGKMYLFGGARDGSVATASVYDPAGDSWQELPPLPEPREHCAAGALDGTLLIAGGRAEGIGGFQPNTWAFDPVALTYEIRAPLLTARGGVAGAVLDGRLLIFGGEGNAGDPTGVFPQVEAYELGSDRWEPLPDMVAPRHGLGAATLDGAIYLPGGASQQGFGAEDTHTMFRLAP